MSNSLGTATKRQLEILEAVQKHGTNGKAANALKVDRRFVDRTIKKLEKRGLVPWRAPAGFPDHLRMGKSTIQIGPTGDIEREWARVSPELNQLNDIVEALCARVDGKGKAPVRRARKTDTKDILAEIDIFDAHVGLYADEKETLDEDYNCDVAAKRMVSVTEGLAARFNRPHKCVLVFGGDMLHSDTRNNRTEQSHNVLDVDSRYDRVLEYIEKACIDVVNIAACVGAEVEVVVLEGNHSWHSEKWLARVLRAYYRNCPNVTINMQRSPRKVLTFGDVFLGWAHGDKIKPADWARIVAAEFAVQWGKTKYRYMKCGHRHHKNTIAPVVVDEQSGIVIEYLEALCATDAYHAGAGYVGNQKGASGFEYHKKLGCITRFLQPV